ncbi:unnamed protein product [Paramecium pentaurelia]|uniref:Uncharacterized protein n=1 Tax=Paramecium pentaurelia TaxID=43138 RepID=A0A8S1X890_9CILI|nr:unnamed protein product [Paramecium pentaurelia]
MLSDKRECNKSIDLFEIQKIDGNIYQHEISYESVLISEMVNHYLSNVCPIIESQKSVQNQTQGYPIFHSLLIKLLFAISNSIIELL